MSAAPRKTAKKKSPKTRAKKKTQTRAGGKASARAIGGKVSAKDNKRSSSMSANENSENQSAQKAVAGIGGALGDETAGAGNLAKVRDILFGAQMRENDKRFSRLEERLVKEIGELQRTTKNASSRWNSI